MRTGDQRPEIPEHELRVRRLLVEVLCERVDVRLRLRPAQPHAELERRVGRRGDRTVDRVPHERGRAEARGLDEELVAQDEQL